MTEIDFLNAVIDDALESVRHLEAAPRRKPFREGAEAALTSCQGKNVTEIRRLLREATQAREAVPRTHGDPATLAAYWYARSAEAQIAWVIEVLVARDYVTGRSVEGPISDRAARAAARILGHTFAA